MNSLTARGPVCSLLPLPVFNILVAGTLIFPTLGFAAGCPDLPGDQSSWKEQERWAWSRICTGHPADLRTFGGGDNPRRAQSWPTQRELSQRFIETVVLTDPYRLAIPRQGVVIIGARFLETVDLGHAKLEHDLWFVNSSFESPAGDALNLVGAEINGRLNFNGSTAIRTMNMDSLHAAALTMSGGPSATDGWILSKWSFIWLATARIERQLAIDDSDVTNELQMSNAVIGTNLSMLNSTLAKVLLRSAAVGGALSIQGPKRRGNICGNRLEPRPQAHAPQFVDLTSASVGTLLLGSTCYGPINAPENWGSGAELVLTSASIHTLQDGLCVEDRECDPAAWPLVELTGFSYKQLESFDNDTVNDMAMRPSEWWRNWLIRQRRFSPEPYEHLAATLSKLGHKDTATDILYYGKERERELASFKVKLGLWLQLVFIGYGYRIYYSVFWVIGFVVIGALVLRVSHQGTKHKMPYGIAFSFDMLLPLVRLREKHYKIDLQGWSRYYFYFHKIMGYVLASFLIAGLSGLTK
jgi:hypothetical protein